MRGVPGSHVRDPEFVETVVLATLELAMADRAWDALRSGVLQAQSRVSDVHDTYDEARRRFPYAPPLRELLGNISLLSRKRIRPSDRRGPDTRSPRAAGVAPLWLAVTTARGASETVTPAAT